MVRQKGAKKDKFYKRVQMDWLGGLFWQCFDAFKALFEK